MLEAALKRDRLIVLASLALVTTLAWGWTLAGPHMHLHMAATGEMALMTMVESVATWSASHAALVFVMWWVMMVAMMLPSATPLVLLGAAVQRGRGGGRPAFFAGLLTAGYLAVWGGFSLAATLAQWTLEASGLLAAHALVTGPMLGGAILVAAGLYQLTPIKQACLSQCRSPAAFLAQHWRPGAAGALRMGASHGSYCLGCCWALMALLFAGGVMNPLWIGLIALYVLLEKAGPRGERLSRVAGAALVGLGLLMFSRAV